VSNSGRAKAQHPPTVRGCGRTPGHLENSFTCEPPLASRRVRGWQSDQQFLAGECCHDRGARCRVFGFSEALSHKTGVGALYTLENLVESCLTLSLGRLNSAYNSSTVSLFVRHLSRLLRILGNVGQRDRTSLPP
jgi:hypothetical protein